MRSALFFIVLFSFLLGINIVSVIHGSLLNVFPSLICCYLIYAECRDLLKENYENH